MFKRLILSKIVAYLKDPEEHRAIILVGQRRTGKTILLREIQKKIPASAYFDLESLPNRLMWEEPSIENLGQVIRRLNPGNRRFLLLFDELQNLQNSGVILKLIHDHFPKIRVLASGSSSFLLLGNIGDSLYGRKIVFELFPLTIGEVFRIKPKEVQNNFLRFDYDNRPMENDFTAKLNDFLIYGTFPEVATAKTPNGKQSLLNDYINSLLFKDIFSCEGIRNPEVFKKLLFMLSLQVGNLINPNEIAQTLGVSRNTVMEYLGIYEKFYVLFRLPPLAINERDEVHTKFKVYFYDLGLRNAIIANFIPPSQRTDIGALLENFVIRSLKVNAGYFAPHLKFYFWRNFNGFEVDLVIKDTTTGRYFPFEIKTGAKTKPSRAFLEKYRGQIERDFSVSLAGVFPFVI